jgi:O-antigen/teichoic acid export membrane protein
VVVQTMRLVAPITVFLLVAAPYILRAFGPSYASEGATLLRLLAAATLPNVIVVLGLSVARIQHSGRAVLGIQAAQCALVLGLGLLLLPRLGIEGIGVAWLASQTAVAAWLMFGILRPVLLAGGRATQSKRESPSRALEGSDG